MVSRYMTWFMRYCCSFRYSSFRLLAHPTIDDVCSFRAVQRDLGQHRALRLTLARSLPPSLPLTVHVVAQVLQVLLELHVRAGGELCL
jgi:hypothetical protein